MAITHAETQVTWPTAANSKAVAGGGDEASEEFNIDDTCVKAQITIKADNSTTPAADDQLYVWLTQTSGDPDGAGADEFDTDEHAQLLGVLDTNKEDPAIMTVPLPLPQKGCKLRAEGVTAGTTNSITVSATVTEQRAA